MNKHLIMVLFDDATFDVFFSYLNRGKLPILKKYIFGDNSSNATICRAITGFPSTSVNSHATILTGAYAGKNNILAASFWTRNNKGKGNPTVTDLEEASFSTIDVWDRTLSPTSPLLFERILPSASFHALNRGATQKRVNKKRMLTAYLPTYLKLKFSGYDNIGGDPEFWRTILGGELLLFLEDVKNAGEFPASCFFPFILSDSIAHKYGFESEEYEKTFQVFDYLIGLLIEGGTYKGRKVVGLKDLGYLDDIIWSVTTDHGSRPINYGNSLSIPEFFSKNNINFREILQKKHNKHDFSSTHALCSITKEFCLIWMNNGIYETNISKDYWDSLTESYLKSLKITSNEKLTEIDLIEAFISQQQVDMVIIKTKTALKKSGDKDYYITIINIEGKSEILQQKKDGKKFYTYNVISGKDPCKYDSEASVLIDGKPHSEDEWVEKTITTTYPDVPHRLFGHFDHLNSPNLIVTAKLDGCFNNPFDLKEKKQNSHDGLFNIESVVPLSFAGKGIRKGHEVKFCRTVDILPTCCKAMDVDFDPESMDGHIIDIFE